MILSVAQLEMLMQEEGPEFQPGVAVALAEQAAAGYLPPQKYELQARKAGFTDAVSFYCGATQMNMAWSQDVVVITLRGSSQFRDWMENLRAWGRKWEGDGMSGEKVHAGFLRQLKRVMPDIEDYLKLSEVHQFRAKLYITGHSLGGALAVLLAAALADRGWVADQVYTFSAPRPAKKGWVSGYGRGAYPHVHRVSHLWRGELDIVTRIPPKRMGWRHVGNSVVVYEDSKSIVSFIEGPDAWRAARKKAKTLLPWWRVISRLSTGARAHDMIALLGALRSYRSGNPADREGRSAFHQLRVAKEEFA